jgi:hypothetical protein
MLLDLSSLTWHTLHLSQIQHHKPQPAFHLNQMNRYATSETKMYSSLHIIYSKPTNREHAQKEHLSKWVETRTFTGMLKLHYKADADVRLTCLLPKATSNRQLRQASRGHNTSNVIYSHVLCNRNLETDVVPFTPFLFPFNGCLFSCTAVMYILLWFFFFSFSFITGWFYADLICLRSSYIPHPKSMLSDGRVLWTTIICKKLFIF